MFGFFGFLADALARSDDEQGEVIAVAVDRDQDVIAETQAVRTSAGVRSGRCGADSQPPGANRWMELPSRSASKNCHTARDLHELSGFLFDASTLLYSSSAFGSRSARSFRNCP